MKKYEDSYSLKTPTLTIIIPAYNVEQYIADTLNSILNQSVQPDEVIIINDGSTDNTSNIIKDHPFYNKIKLIEVDNMGQGLARNIGIAKATSDYIYFFDSDDLITKDFIEKIHKIIIKNKYPDLIFFSGKSFIDKGYNKSHFRPNYIRPFEGSFNNQNTFLNTLIQNPELSCSPCLYVSKRLLWDKKLKFNSFYHEDDEVFYPLIFNASSYVVTTSVFFHRRIRSDSTMTQTKSLKHLYGQKAILESLLRLLDSEETDSLKSRLIRRRLASFSIVYIATSKEINTNIDYKLFFHSLVKSRSLVTPLRIIKYKAKKYVQTLTKN